MRERRSIEPAATPVQAIVPDVAAAEDEAALPSDSGARPDEDKKC